jgi:hypothetical protein
MAALRKGDRVQVPWGISDHRYGTVIEVWGNPKDPSHLRIEFDPLPDDDAPAIRLLSPSMVHRAEVDRQPRSRSA